MTEYEMTKILDAAADLKGSCSVRFKCDQRGTMVKITKAEGGKAVTADFEYNGYVIGNTYPINVDALEDALKRIADGDTSYFTDEKGTLDERVNREYDFAGIIKRCGWVENKCGIPDSERYTICYGENDYIVKPDVLREQLANRCEDWEWIHYAQVNMNPKNKNFVRLLGKKNVGEVAELALDNDIYIHASTWCNGYDEDTRSSDYTPYWQTSVDVKGYGSFNFDRSVRCSRATGDKGVEWVIKELKKIASDPVLYQSASGQHRKNREELQPAIDKLSSFTKQLEDYYNTLKKSRDSVERD